MRFRFELESYTVHETRDGSVIGTAADEVWGVVTVQVADRAPRTTDRIYLVTGTKGRHIALKNYDAPPVGVNFEVGPEETVTVAWTLLHLGRDAAPQVVDKAIADLQSTLLGLAQSAAMSGNVWAAAGAGLGAAFLEAVEGEIADCSGVIAADALRFTGADLLARIKQHDEDVGASVPGSGRYPGTAAGGCGAASDYEVGWRWRTRADLKDALPEVLGTGRLPGARSHLLAQVASGELLSYDVHSGDYLLWRRDGEGFGAQPVMTGRETVLEGARIVALDQRARGVLLWHPADGRHAWVRRAEDDVQLFERTSRRHSAHPAGLPDADSVIDRQDDGGWPARQEQAGPVTVQEGLAQRTAEEVPFVVTQNALERTTTDAPLVINAPPTEYASGVWKTIKGDVDVVPVGATSQLVWWKRDTDVASQYQVWEREPLQLDQVHEDGDPLTTLEREGSWQTITHHEHVLVPIRSDSQFNPIATQSNSVTRERVLDWCRRDGSFRVWEFSLRRAPRRGDDPFPLEPLTQGYWSWTSPDDELIAFDGDVVHWNRGMETYRLLGSVGQLSQRPD